MRVISQTFAVLLIVGVCSAVPPATDFIFPAGAQRGTSVDARVGGFYFHGRAEFTMEGLGAQQIKEINTIWFDGPMLIEPASQKSEDYPKDHLARLSIAKDAPLGTRTWWCRTSQGSTPSMKFIVGDLAEVIEHEIEGNPIPQTVTLPVTINGRVFPREDADLWRFHAKQGETIRCEVASQSIGYPLQAVLNLTTASGKPVSAQKQSSRAGDPSLTFVAPADDEYQVAINDAAYLGAPNHVYRLTLQRGPAQAQPLIETTNQVLILRGVVDGCISKPGEVDEWLVDLAETQSVLFDIATDKERGWLDSMLTLHTADGALLTKNDDRIEGQTDSRIHYTAAKAGRYLIKVADRFATRGGSDFGYRLHAAAHAAAGFELTLGSDVVNVMRQTEAEAAADPKTKSKPARGTGLRVDVTPFGAFKSKINLDVIGLPAGVTAENTVINPSQRFIELAFTAPPATPLQLARVTVRGTADGVTHTTSEARLVIAPSVPFKHIGEYWVTNDQPAGTTMKKRYELERGGFTGPITVSLADRQGRGLQALTATPLLVPADATSFEYTVMYPPEVELGHTSRIQLMLTAEITDTDGSRHTISHTSFEQEDQMISVTTDGLLRIIPGEGTFTFTPAGHTAVPFVVKRHPALASRPLRVELQVPRHIRDVTAKPVDLAPEKQSGELRLDFGKTPGPFNMPVTIIARTTDTIAAPHNASAKIELLPALRTASRP